MSDEIEKAIEENAKGLKKASGDGGSAEQHSIEEQIAADKHIASKKAAQSRGLGIKLVKISPDGTT